MKEISIDKRKILVLVGEGKDVLSNFIMSCYDNEGMYVLRGLPDVVRTAHDIKKEIESGFTIIVHLQDKSEVKKLPLAIRRRSIMFNLEKII